jgi:gamma-tubulin complex component 3
MSISLKEVDLVSDCLYCFQGIEGHNIIYDIAADGFIVRKDIPVSLPIRRLINQLCEIGWLYRRVQTYLNEKTDVIDHLNPKPYRASFSRPYKMESKTK